MIALKDSHVSSSEAAMLLGIHPFTIQTLLRAGRLPAEKIANRWLIRRETVEEFAKTYVPKVGRPRKKRKYIRRRQA